MRTTGRRTAVAAALLATAAATALVSSTQASAASQSERRQDLAEARAATAKYHDVAAAKAAGYRESPVCEESPAGAMGYHYAKPSRFGSTDPSEPAVLLYAPDGKGGLRLAGVEYVVPDRDQDLSTDGDRPSMFDGKAFQGPMEGHVDGMPRHYDLHVWVWNSNPSGMFAQWNPSFSCP